ncbi:MAG: 16S rRNA (guanine(527)-N(7))-methyltransferase RsmG [Candidatus Latescibacteria bacterium]|nr:16S rRNA (guanine(527)-N(7))-methyltransferase RsmG [Candidatus Latescibacterota bacterium]
MFHVKQADHLPKKTASCDASAIRDGCGTLGFSVTDAQLCDLLLHLDSIRTWRGRVNLVAPNDFPRLVSRHVLDSLTALPWLPSAPPLSLLDIGSGAGFPGIPLQILRPNLHVTLLESRRKRALFLRKVAAQVSCPHLSVLHARAEEVVEDPEHRHRYDLITLRAVAPLAQAIRLAFPLLAPSGRIIAYGGPDAREAVRRLLDECPSLPLALLDHRRIPVPFLSRFSYLVLVGAPTELA